jgi:hypothetical protein
MAMNKDNLLKDHADFQNKMALPMQSFSSDFNPINHQEKELSQHLEVSLKIAGNLKELTD